MVTDKPQEAPEKGVESSGGNAAVADTREFKSVPEAQREQADNRDEKLQKSKAYDLSEKGARDRILEAVGKPHQMAIEPAVVKNIQDGQQTDNTLRIAGDQMNFAAMSAGLGLSDIAGRSGPNGRRPLDNAGRPQDRPAEAAQPGSDQGSRPGDNNVRDVDPGKDNPQAVQQRYNQMVDGLNLPADQAAKMKEQFQKDMDKVQQKFQGDDLNHIMRSMNLMMDGNNHLQNDANRVNAVAGLAARGANPEEANRQGANPTCALTSESRIEQQRNFVKYADQMGSVAARGGAWRGGENGQPPVFVNVDAPGTNGANFRADNEASQMYDKNFHQSQGHRDYLGQLDNAVVGGEMAHYAGQRDGKEYVYVAANAQRAGADVSQGSSNGALMERGPNGTLRQSYDGNQAVNSPPSTLDMVARVNAANGGGGLFVQENLAAQFRGPDGKYPPGMNVFRDANDLREQLKQHPNQEYQIATNGVIVAGMQGHGLHAQTVKYNERGQLEFGNNWTDKDNHRVYDDSFVNTFTDSKQWNNYHPQHTAPDGQPDWRKERVGPGTQDVVDKRNSTDDKAKDDDKKKKEQEDADKEKEKNKTKEKEKEEQEEQRKKDQKLQQQKHADEEYNSKKLAWDDRKTQHAAAVQRGEAQGEFSEKEPERGQLV